MARSTDPLVVGRVVGDVIDLFVPSVDMAVYYGAKQVTNGCEIKPSTTVNRPNVQIAGRYYEDSLYTLVMTDPDAPSPSEPNLREWIHWLVTDIPGATDPSQGREVLPYMGPRPPIGIHRYVFVLFKQAGPMVMVVPPQQRNNFSTRAFAAHYGLGLPVATVYFNAQKEPGTRKR
uniref:MFT-like protein n=1 Tax=Sciadopitys verticillata TaxID=28979 RepID=A0A1B1LTH3_SCIVE|nr:MFT-like protein [Sciadopitys verticillata]